MDMSEMIFKVYRVFTSVEGRPLEEIVAFGVAPFQGKVAVFNCGHPDEKGISFLFRPTVGEAEKSDITYNGDQIVLPIMGEGHWSWVVSPTNPNRLIDVGGKESPGISNKVIEAVEDLVKAQIEMGVGGKNPAPEISLAEILGNSPRAQKMITPSESRLAILI